jgi:hypothetical protein
MHSRSWSLASRLAVAAFFFSGCAGPHAILSTETEGDPKLVIVTFDGLRWQEIFRGADQKLAHDPRFVGEDWLEDWVDKPYLKPMDRPAALTPFLHQVVAADGVLIGNRDEGECARVANDMWFSYPGYIDLLTGSTDPSIVENDDKWNANVSFLEYLNQIPAFAGRVQMLGTWSLFPKIVNSERSGIPVNAGFGDRGPTDAMTWRFGRQLLLREKPRVLYLAFGDTDEYAHGGDYMNYLAAIERGDDVLRQIWEMLQADPYYRDQTTLIVTTDHGRGDDPVEAWQDHSAVRYHKLNPDYQPQYNATGVKGSGDVWFAAIGPAVRREGATTQAAGQCAETRQVAASGLSALNEDWRRFDPEAGAPFPFIRTGDRP